MGEDDREYQIIGTGDLDELDRRQLQDLLFSFIEQSGFVVLRRYHRYGDDYCARKVRRFNATQDKSELDHPGKSSL